MKNTSEKYMQMLRHCMSQAPTVKKLILLWTNLYELGYQFILVAQVLTASNAPGPRHQPLYLHILHRVRSNEPASTGTAFTTVRVCWRFSDDLAIDQSLGSELMLTYTSTNVTEPLQHAVCDKKGRSVHPPATVALFNIYYGLHGS